MSALTVVGRCMQIYNPSWRAINPAIFQWTRIYHLASLFFALSPWNLSSSTIVSVVLSPRNLSSSAILPVAISPRHLSIIHSFSCFIATQLVLLLPITLYHLRLLFSLFIASDPLKYLLPLKGPPGSNTLRTPLVFHIVALSFSIYCH